MDRVLSGSCLCGGVKYQITGELFMAAYCHCSMCRKAHGSAFRPRALVLAEHFRWVQGKELVTDYESSPGAHRMFCRRCGSPLIARSDEYPTIYNIALGTLDDDPGIRVLRSIGTLRPRPPWFEIADNLRQFPEFPPMPANS
jgi:hypothetical protein